MDEGSNNITQLPFYHVNEDDKKGEKFLNSDPTKVGAGWGGVGGGGVSHIRF